LQGCCTYDYDEVYATELRSIAPTFGFAPEQVDHLLELGFAPEEIEEFFYGYTTEI